MRIDAMWHAVQRRGGSATKGAIGISASIAVGQVVFLLISPILTRLYSPDAFGLFTVLTSAIAVLAVVATLRLEIAIPLAASDRDARRALSTSILAAFAICAAASIGIIFGKYEIAGAFAGVNVESWLWIVPVSAFFFGAYEVVSQYAVRHKRYGVLGKRSLIQNLVMSGAQLGIGFTASRGGLLLGQLAGKFFAILFTLSNTGLATRSLIRDVTLVNSRQSLRKNWRFPTFLMPSALLNTLGTQAPFVIIGLFFGAPIVGLLGLTQRVLAAPASLMAQAVSSVYMGESSSRSRNAPGSNLGLFVKTTITLAMLATPFFVIVYLLAPVIFGPIFGEQWKDMGGYAQAMSLFFLFQFVVSPVSQTLVIHGAQVTQFFWDLVRVIVVVLAICVGYWLGWGPLATVWMYSIASAICYAVLWLLSFAKVRSAHAARQV